MLNVNEGEHQLPGVFIQPGETLEVAARRAALQKTGIEVGEVHQLRLFDSPDRDSRAWVISAAFFAAVPYAVVHQAMEGVLEQSGHALPLAVVPVDDAIVAHLKYDHSDIVLQSATHLRGEYQLRPDPYRFLDKEELTLLELRTAHETVAGHRILKDTFRRRMTPKLIDTGEVTQGLLGKPARLYRRKPTAGPRKVHHSDWID